MQLLEKLGGVYVDGHHVQADALDDHFGQIDMIREATGVAALEFHLIDALGINGVYVITGIPGGDRPLDIPGAALMRQLVLYNEWSAYLIFRNRLRVFSKKQAGSISKN